MSVFRPKIDFFETYWKFRNPPPPYWELIPNNMFWLLPTGTYLTLVPCRLWAYLCGNRGSPDIDVVPFSCVPVSLSVLCPSLCVPLCVLVPAGAVWTSAAEATSTCVCLYVLTTTFLSCQRSLKEIHITTLTNPCNNFDKSMYQLWLIHPCVCASLSQLQLSSSCHFTSWVAYFLCQLHLFEINSNSKWA